MDRRRRFGVPLLLAVILVGVLAYLVTARNPVVRPIAYWVIDETTLGVAVTDAPGIRCAMSDPDESETTIQIRAECLEPLIALPRAGGAHISVFEARLGGAIGSRTVVDGLGALALHCERPVPDCAPPL